jgi:hypothetical protein
MAASTTKLIQIEVPEADHRALRVLAATRGTTVRALLVPEIRRIIESSTSASAPDTKN